MLNARVVYNIITGSMILDVIALTALGWFMYYAVQVMRLNR